MGGIPNLREEEHHPDCPNKNLCDSVLEEITTYCQLLLDFEKAPTDEKRKEIVPQLCQMKFWQDEDGVMEKIQAQWIDKCPGCSSFTGTFIMSPGGSYLAVLDHDPKGGFQELLKPLGELISNSAYATQIENLM